MITLATMALYFPPKILTGRFSIVGLDYFQLHRCRLEYAREFIFRSFCLPGWYTREFLGSPFWSNLHNFSWLPNHLMLLLFNPAIAYNVAVIVSALLSAGAMFFYCRSIELSHLAATVSAWTYAASGFFASRVMAGQLHILETYGSLPLLFWIVEKYSIHRTRSVELCLLTAVCALCLSGHPQIPAYSIGASIVYAFFRLDRKLFFRCVTLMAQAIAISSFAWIPMLMLLVRSSRTIDLGPATNNVIFPYGRLGAYLSPWKDGWPAIVMRSPSQIFSFSNNADFWDTVCYVGWLPIVSFIGGLYLSFRRKFIDGPWLFLGGMGVLSLVMSLPLREHFFKWFPWTLFRSPARQIYLLNFSLIVFLGAFLDRLAQSRWRIKNVGPICLVAVLVAAHVVDLYRHSHAFVRLISAEPVPMPKIDAALKAGVNRARVGIDFNIFIDANRKYDDVGFYNAVTLAMPYKQLLPKNSLGQFENVEEFSGSQLSQSTLSRLGIKFVVTPRDRTDLTKQLTEKTINLYSVPNPTPRVGFFPGKDADVTDKEQVRLESSAPEDLTGVLERNVPDEMVLSFRAPEAGFVQFIESWDIGWRAQLNGKPVPVLKSNEFLMAVPVAPGDNTIRLFFRTPGKFPGLLISLLGILWSIRFFTGSSIFYKDAVSRAVPMT